MSVLGKEGHRRGFLALWNLSGKPMLKIISPISEWTLPAGVTYKPHQDIFANGSGTKVAVGWADQPYTDAQFISARADNDVQIDIPGSRTLSTMNVIILWTADIEAAIRVAWGIAIGDDLYTVRTWTTNPQGVVTPFTIRATLGKR